MMHSEERRVRRRTATKTAVHRMRQGRQSEFKQLRQQLEEATYDIGSTMRQITDLESKQVILTKTAQEVEKLFTAAHAQQQQLAEQVHMLSAVAQVTVGSRKSSVNPVALPYPLEALTQ